MWNRLEEEKEGMYNMMQHAASRQRAHQYTEVASE